MTRPLLHLTSVQPQEFCKRAETLGERVLSLHKIATDLPSEILKGKIAIVGIPDDRGVAANGGHGGAAQGPKAFRESFYKLYDTPIREFCERSKRATAHSPCFRAGQLLSSTLVDAGDVILQSSIADTHEVLASVVDGLVRSGVSIVFVIGGGHDFSFGSYKGHATALGGVIPIINLDAHFDLRRPDDGAQINSGTPFYRIIESLPERICAGQALLELGIQRERNPSSLFDYAAEHRIRTVEYQSYFNRWRDVFEGREVTALEHVLDHLDDCTKLNWQRMSGSVHLSLDLDVFHSALAPGTSAATPLGVSLSEVGPVLSYFGRTRMCRVVDIAELCPSRDQNSQTARLAAGIVYQFALARHEYGAG